MSFIPLVLKQDRRWQKNERGVQGGADSATANTKNGCGSGPPLSPHSAPRTHTPVYYLKEGIGGLL